MKNINLGIGLLIGFLLVLSIGFVSADAVALSDPNGTAVYNGTQITLNASNTTTAGAQTMFVNCTFYGKATDTANSTYTKIGNVTNATTGGGAGILYLNDTWNSLTSGKYYFEDSSAISIYASCWFQYDNATGSLQVNSTAVTSITLNNSFPSAPTTPVPSTNSVDTNGTLTLYSTVVGENVTACTIYFPQAKPGSITGGSMTHSGDNCSYTVKNCSDGTYEWLVQASDGAEASNSSRWYVSVDTTRGVHTTPEIQAEGEDWLKQKELAAAGEGGMSTTAIIAIVVVIFVVIAILIKRRK